MDSAQWDERYSTSELIWTGRANQFVEAHLADLEPGTAIDLGAGEGRNAVWLASRGWTVTAVDFSQVGLDKAQQLAAEHGVEISHRARRRDHLAPDAPVDLVVLSYLQLPSEQQRIVLEHAATWLAPGGTLFVIAHDRSNVEHGYGGPPSAGRLLHRRRNGRRPRRARRHHRRGRRTPRRHRRRHEDRARHAGHRAAAALSSSARAAAAVVPGAVTVRWPILRPGRASTLP